MAVPGVEGTIKARFTAGALTTLDAGEEEVEGGGYGEDGGQERHGVKPGAGMKGQQVNRYATHTHTADNPWMSPGPADSPCPSILKPALPRLSQKWHFCPPEAQPDGGHSRE